MRIAICVATYKRPDGLRRLLLALDRLTFTTDPPEVEVVVVDNDPGGSAVALCEGLQHELRWPIRCVVEKNRGIPQARNRAVETAGEAADFIAFIDDDEVPDTRWLDELIVVQREHGADVVTGAVAPLFEKPPPDWVTRGGFFDRKTTATGSRLRHAFTNNVLVSRAVLERMAPCFHEGMALTGGTDRHFFQRVRMAGYSIVWANDALVDEWIPPTRTTARWLIQRAYRTGNATSAIEKDLNAPWRVIPIQVAKGMVWIGLGLVCAPFAPLAGRHRLVHCARWMAYGAGLLAGLTGARYEEYRRIHGA